MQTYLVGGAVRDLQMGLEPKDRDYVVVGGTAEAMLALGFRQQGKDFPVFVHPDTQEEHALARVERKTGSGHTGFAVSTANVTLEEDLFRRDLTINSMAMTGEGVIVDPFGGQRDLANRVLRHTGPAFTEDPLRILRIARFLARLGPDWRVADETYGLVIAMVDDAALDELPFERFWKELERGLMEPYPDLMFRFMHGLNLFTRVAKLRPLGAQPGEAALERLRRAADAGLPATVRFATACTGSTVDQDRPQGLPVEFWDIARSAHAVSGLPVRQFRAAGADAQLSILGALDATRRPARCAEVLAALQVDGAFDESDIYQAVAALKAIDKRALAASCATGAEVGEKLELESRRVLREAFV